MTRWRRSLPFVSSLLCAAQFAQASKPLSERSAETCEQFLSGGHQGQALPFAPSTLIPLHTLLGSVRCENLTKLWRVGSFCDRRFPSAGTQEMFRTADEAARSILESLKIQAVAPEYDTRNVFAGAAATLALMESARPPAYIRQAVLIRDGVLMVVPLLKRVRLLDSKTGKAVYEPILTKGHQALDELDVLGAAFAAWALEPWQGQWPEHAHIYLRPTDKKRRRADESVRNLFSIDTADHRDRVLQIYERFVNVASSDRQMAEIGPRRCTHCQRCPWAAYCRQEMKGTGHLSMIPFPPSALQQALLSDLGIGNLSKLAELDVNSPRFTEVALRTGIPPERLWYFVARALSVEKNLPFIMRSFENPFPKDKPLLHIDFEDIHDANLLSGVYLFGLAVEVGGKEKKTQAIWAKDLTQEGIDNAWAEFLRYTKRSTLLKGKDFAVTIYSKHELVKFEQEFDILKQAPQAFTEAERASRFYWESEVDGKSVGRLIRRQSFFEKYQDLKPADVFDLMGRFVDLLEFPRKNMAFPTYSNGLKNLLPLVQGPKPRLSYPEGQNGLESLAWARQAYLTGEPHLFARNQSYNLIDVRANAAVVDFLRKNAENPALKAIVPSEKTRELWPALTEAVALRRLGQNLESLAGDFHSALGRRLGELSAEDLTELQEILNRSDYLAALKEAASDDASSEGAEKQMLRFQFVQERSRKLRHFFASRNPQIEANPLSAASQAAVRLATVRAASLIPKIVGLIVAYEELRPLSEQLSFDSSLPLEKSLKLPDSWRQQLTKAFSGPELLSESELESLLTAIYLAERFPQGAN